MFLMDFAIQYAKEQNADTLCLPQIRKEPLPTNYIWVLVFNKKIRVFTA